MRTLKNILALSSKELRSLLSDTILVIFIVMMFSTMVYNTATNATFDVRNANIGIVDYDRSPLTRQIVAALLPPQFAKPVYVHPNWTKASSHLCWNFRRTSSATCWPGARPKRSFWWMPRR